VAAAQSQEEIDRYKMESIKKAATIKQLDLRLKEVEKQSRDHEKVISSSSTPIECGAQGIVFSQTSPSSIGLAAVLSPEGKSSVTPKKRF